MSNKLTSAPNPPEPHSPNFHTPCSCFLDDDPLARTNILTLALLGLQSMASHSELRPCHFEDVICLAQELWAQLHVFEVLTEAQRTKGAGGAA